jgi:hypothetical protein
MYVKDLKVGALYRPKSPSHDFGFVRDTAYVDWGKRLNSRLMVYLGEDRTDGFITRWCLIGDKRLAMAPNEWRKIEPVEEM